jgi:hypothetical protein
LLIKLQDLQYKAHNPVMKHNSPIRLLEVNVLELGPTKWKWQVLSRDAEVAQGVESSRETAQIRGNDELFNLLSKC